jgi:hypothetical protein
LGSCGSRSEGGPAMREVHANPAAAELRPWRLVDLARTCAAQSRLTNSRDVAQALWRLATDYMERAAKLEGRRPDIGDPPALLR